MQAAAGKGAQRCTAGEANSCPTGLVCTQPRGAAPGSKGICSAPLGIYLPAPVGIYLQSEEEMQAAAGKGAQRCTAGEANSCPTGLVCTQPRGAAPGSKGICSAPLGIYLQSKEEKHLKQAAAGKGAAHPSPPEGWVWASVGGWVGEAATGEGAQECTAGAANSCPTGLVCTPPRGAAPGSKGKCSAPLGIY